MVYRPTWVTMGGTTLHVFLEKGNSDGNRDRKPRQPCYLYTHIPNRDRKDNITDMTTDTWRCCFQQPDSSSEFQCNAEPKENFSVLMAWGPWTFMGLIIGWGPEICAAPWGKYKKGPVSSKDPIVSEDPIYIHHQSGNLQVGPKKCP